MGSSRDFTINELMNMRDAGMTNHDIANSTGLSYQTVLRRIGKQPGRMRTYDAPPTPRPSMEIRPQVEEEVYEASLLVDDRVITLVGEVCGYTILFKEKSIKIERDGEIITLSMDQITTFIKELAAIERKADSLRVEPEMW